MEHYRNIGTAYLGVVVIVGLALLAPAWLFAARPSADFFDTRVTIDDGLPLSKVAVLLEEKGVIRYDLPFRILVRVAGRAGNIRAGTYIFKWPASLFGVAARIIRGDFGITPIRFVVFEGDSVEDIGIRLASHLENFDARRYKALTKNLEGELYPETYFFFPSDTVDKVVSVIHNTFVDKVGGIDRDVLIMASIIEREAPDDFEDQKIIAGILWKRIEDGMPLQVDAPFAYYLDRNTYELTKMDLASDSPYNTYKNKGLPPTPIGNPGQDAIDAAKNPKETDYWFYLSDKSGGMHYAVTFAEHKANKARYVR